MKKVPEITLTGGTAVYGSSGFPKFNFPIIMQGKIVKSILTVKHWLQLKEAQTYQQWYNEKVAPDPFFNIDESTVPDEILNLKTLTPRGQDKNYDRIMNLSKWLDETDDGI